ncbi:hypothetical protein TVAG_117040 [Trichomonas vaginalis G3]|uniref:Uncharacterized protein n=1 Tax=Trichomonas vaginalis (strain ATCC PRA-98 / G3) TaxID=412133 RepID=A2E3P4_TRIV3|nr:hypothetical protein TVAGG3_0507800 [Trichomonas vaginalis G3]EAY12682.1 hypothetical protein TVAG_117040 [Trichomonas vaginalis G3]KAI5517556.1 hypothetical protein TVAGG3_0507800 [Trichomonas vaginalis G3]|eukprot:XP_001324905.1 hypothetical protein [Trichomonas vaginalis G3]
MLKIKKILPFLGISFLCTYWLAIFDSSAYIRDSLSCYNSVGYEASRDFYSKNEIINLFTNCSEINIDKSSIGDVRGPILTYYFQDSPPISTNMNNFESEFHKHHVKATKMILRTDLTYTAPKFKAHFMKIIRLHRNGVLFSARQIIKMDRIDIKHNFFIRYIASLIAFVFLFFHKRRRRNLLPFILSSLTVIMHVFLFGRFLQTFRIVAAICWLIEFLNMLNLKYRGFSIVIPIILLTLACSMIFYGIFMTHSKWFKDITTSYIVTVSLMVGDHIQETMTSLHGHSAVLFFRFICSSTLVLILTFIIMASVGKPFNKLVSSNDTNQNNNYQM